MIEAKQVRYRVHGREILRGIDFHVEEGEFVGLIGPNGSGKSTFLKNIYKVLHPQSGDISLMGGDLLETESQEDRALAAQILERTQLTPLREQVFSTLSGGEKQRVLMARALAQQTPVLILDEPTNHLDVKYQLQLMELLRQSGRTVVAAIHDLNLAAAYCHRLYALKNGVIVGEGTPRELLTPAFLREVYEVEAEVLTGRDGVLRVFFCPQRAEAWGSSQSPPKNSV